MIDVVPLLFIVVSFMLMLVVMLPLWQLPIRWLLVWGVVCNV